MHASETTRESIQFNEGITLLGERNLHRSKYQTIVITMISISLMLVGTLEFIRFMMQETCQAIKVPPESYNLSLIRTQKREYCFKPSSFEGYIMEDGTGCWSLGNEMLVSDDRFHNKQHTQHIVSMDIQSMLANKTILIIGDSRSRYAFNALKSVITGEEPTFKWSSQEFHSNIVSNVGQNTTIYWQWGHMAKGLFSFLDTPDGMDILKKADHTLIMLGIHEVIWNFDANEKTAKTLALNLRTKYATMSKDLVFETAPPILIPQLDKQTPPKADMYQRTYPHVTSDNIFKFNQLVVRGMSMKGSTATIPVLNGFWRFQTDDSDGMHSTNHAIHTAYRFLWRIFWI